MPDLDVLRQRVEDAERRLTTVQNSRENECQSLMDMWMRIRDRFQDQEQEIAAYRTRLATLQDANVELTELIGSMLMKVESSVSQSMEETVPTIAEMARNLLEAEPAPADATDDASAAIPETGNAEPSLGAIVDSEILNLEPATESRIPRLLASAGNAILDLPEKMRFQATAADTAPNGTTDHSLYADQAMEDAYEDAPDPEPPADTESQGVRNLRSRIDNAVRRPISADGPGDDSDADEIGRELEEIELLRKELSGLRERITTASAAE